MMTTGENCLCPLGPPHMERTMERAMWVAGWGWELGVKITSKSQLLLPMAGGHCALRPGHRTKSKAATFPGRSCFRPRGIGRAVSMLLVYTA